MVGGGTNVSEVTAGGSPVQHGDDGRARGTPPAVGSTGTATMPPASWARHSNRNCYPGYGAVDLGQSRVEPTEQVLSECIARCLKSVIGCEAVTILARARRRRDKNGDNCFYRRQEVPDLCGQDKRFDTYTHAK